MSALGKKILRVIDAAYEEVDSDTTVDGDTVVYNVLGVIEQHFRAGSQIPRLPAVLADDIREAKEWAIENIQ